jgi:hypothetical protein
MVLRVFAGACVLYSLPPRVYHMIQICRRRRTEAQVALRTNLGTSMRALNDETGSTNLVIICLWKNRGLNKGVLQNVFYGSIFSVYVLIVLLRFWFFWFFPFLYEQFGVSKFEAHFYKYGVGASKWEHAVFS